MAMPLEPVTTDEMFPDTLVQPFEKAPEVAELAADVMARWDEFKSLRSAIDAEYAPLEIAYVFDTKKLGDDEDWTIHTVVNASKASPLWRSLTGYGAVIAYRKAFWDLQDTEARASFLHHGLQHIDALAGKVTIRPHPAEGFPWTLRRYGPLSFGETQFVRAGSLWNEDHPTEPTPLRSVEDEDR
jgi:hypothetical protein